MQVDYCTASDVTDNLKGVVVDTTTTVTTATLAKIISQESAVIDQHIRARYTLPITDAVSLLFLEKIAIDLSVFRISKILQPKVAAPIPDQKGRGTSQDISHVTAFKLSMQMLRDILNGKTTLPGETETATNFIASTAVDGDDPVAFDFRDTDGGNNINVDLW